jgi:hypothetical protein
MSNKKKTGARKSPATKKRRAVPWDDVANKKLKELYPTATWKELLKALPGHTKGAIVAQATRLSLARPARGRHAHADVLGKKKAEKPPVSDEQLARFMTRGRSVREVAKAFDLSKEEAEQRLAKGFDGYDLFVGPKNVEGDPTYVAVPRAGTFKVSDKAWQWKEAPAGQPYGAVQFPKDFNHQKIRIIPLDGILYGDQAHDAARFDAIVKKIAREPNTFCFLNGDIIAEIKGGKREAREQRLLELAVEFGNKMRPIAHKIMWAQQGCLEARSRLHQGFDPLEHFCGKAGIPYFTEPVYVDLFWGDQLFTIWTMHGHSTAQVKGAKMNALRRPAQVHEFTHFILMGHVGDSIWNRVIKVCRDPVAGSLIPREEFHVILNNFKHYFGTRAARRGETPPSNEAVVLYVYPSGDHHVKTEHGGKS